MNYRFGFIVGTLGLGVVQAAFFHASHPIRYPAFTTTIPIQVTRLPSSSSAGGKRNMDASNDRTLVYHPSSVSVSSTTALALSSSSSSSSSSSRFANRNNGKDESGIFAKIADALSQRRNSGKVYPEYHESKSAQARKRSYILTLLRVGVPSMIWGVIATLTFPGIAMFMATYMTDPGVFSVLSQDASQFVQNFLSVSSLLFSLLVGQTYYFLYTQQESIYYALFEEVTEAKSLLEQVALVCSGRSMYTRCLESISMYVQNDLKKIQADPAMLLSARPVDDPLESIMYMTSVGVPSTIYETVKSLREARAKRLGALQRKLPAIHMMLLWVLAVIELISFPLLGAGTQSIGGYKILTVEGLLFGVITFGIVLTMRVVGELWRPAGGAYNVDSVLSVMVSGLEEELKARMSGRSLVKGGQSASSVSSEHAPSAISSDRKKNTNAAAAAAATSTSSNDTTTTTIQQQGGADIGFAVKIISNWICKFMTVVRKSK